MKTHASTLPQKAQEKFVFHSKELWERLTLPHPGIEQPEIRRRVHLLSSLLVVLVLGGIFCMGLTLLLRDPLFVNLIVLASAAALGIAYGLSRTRHYPAAVALTVATIWVTVLTYAILAHAPDFLYFLILTVLISSQFLSPKATYLTTLANVATILLLSNLSPGFPFSEIIDDVVFVTLTGGLAIVTASVQLFDFKHIEQQSNALSAQLIELNLGRESLQRSQTRLASILENAAEAIVSTDESQKIILFNTGAEKIFGYRAAEVLGQPLELLLPERFAHTHHRQVQVFGAPSQTGRSMGERQEVFGLRKDGAEFPAQVGISTHLENGQLIFTAVLADITERKVAEARIRCEAARAEALSRVADRLNAQLDLDAVLAAVCEEVSRALDVPAVSISLYDEAGARIVHAADLGWSKEIAGLIQPMPRAVYDRLAKRFGPVASFENVHLIPWFPNLDFYIKENIHSVVIVSMLREGNLIGTIKVYGKDRSLAFQEDEIALVKGIANEAAQAVTNARLYEETRARAAQLTLLYDMGLALNSILEPRPQLEYLFNIAMDTLAADRAGFFRFDPAQKELRPDLSIGYEEGLIQSLPKVALEAAPCVALSL